VGVALVCAAAIAVAGIGFVSGGLVLPFDMNRHATSASGWGAFLVVVLFAPTALLLALVGYQQMIEKLVAEIDQQRRQLTVLVGHDALTGLPQMGIASDRLDAAIAQSRRHHDKVALLFIDLDGFKLVNDVHGHAAGDYLLQEVAQRLRASVSANDTVARVGGDEFLIVLARLGSESDADAVAQRVLEMVGRPVAWQARTLQVGASIGIALYPDHASEAGMLRPLADAAMYGVKRHGRNGYRFAELR
jgi:diguanylate cyclase (GGDEF)-like protein